MPIGALGQRPRPSPPPIASAGESFALAAFLADWSDCPCQVLAASDSQALPPATLLRLAEPDDLDRLRRVGLGYTDPRGAPWLRATIAARYAGLGADDVLACAGAQEALTCTMRALLAPGDHAVVVLPIYHPSERAVTALCAATGVPLDPAAEGWRLDLDRLAAALRPDTRLVLANFPNSPTGAPIDGATLERLVALCRGRGLWLVNDEVYRQTDETRGQGEGAPPAVDAYERGISINGLSKGFGLPGLRVGWIACRDRSVLARALAAKSELSSCLAGPSEVLARIALTAEARVTGWTRAIAGRNRRRLHALLARHPELFAPDGSRNLAFAFPRVLGAEGAEGFARRLAREAGLLVLPSTLWRSDLAPTPVDRLRLGLGQAGSGAAIGRLGAYLRAGAPVRARGSVSRARPLDPLGRWRG